MSQGVQIYLSTFWWHKLSVLLYLTLLGPAGWGGGGRGKLCPPVTYMGQFLQGGRNGRLMSFFFNSSTLACVEPQLELFEVWEKNVRQIIIIANGINSQTALARVLDELERNQKKRKSSKYNFQDHGNIGSGPAIHVYLQEGCNPTWKYAKNRRLGVKSVKIMVL